MPPRSEPPHDHHRRQPRAAAHRRRAARSRGSARPSCGSRSAGTASSTSGPDGPDPRPARQAAHPAAGRPVPTALLDAENWYAAWLALPEADRGTCAPTRPGPSWGRAMERRARRRLRAARPGRPRIGSGPAATWARGRAAGRRDRRCSPPGAAASEASAASSSARVRPGGSLLVADETAVPALASILESLPADTHRSRRHRGARRLRLPRRAHPGRHRGALGRPRPTCTRGADARPPAGVPAPRHRRPSRRRPALPRTGRPRRRRLGDARLQLVR